MGCHGIFPYNTPPSRQAPPVPHLKELCKLSDSVRFGLLRVRFGRLLAGLGVLGGRGGVREEGSVRAKTVTRLIIKKSRKMLNKYRKMSRTQFWDFFPHLVVAFVWQVCPVHACCTFWPVSQASDFSTPETPDLIRNPFKIAVLSRSGTTEPRMNACQSLRFSMTFVGCMPKGSFGNTAF